MGLRWEFSECSHMVTFMDLNIELSHGKLHTSLYAKPLALHLYIPPSSCHAPGIATGLIFGHFFRVFLLCSHESDIEHEIYLFFNRLLDRGYSLSTLLPIFLNAELKARHAREKQLRELLLQNPHNQRTPQRQSIIDSPTPNAQLSRGTTNMEGIDNGVFFHLKYHPANPPASTIQRMWRRHVLTPHRATPLYHLRNKDGCRVNIRKLTIAYSRAPNLGNLLSCRKLQVNIAEYTDAHTGLLRAAEEQEPHNANINTTTYVVAEEVTSFTTFPSLFSFPRKRGLFFQERTRALLPTRPPPYMYNSSRIRQTPWELVPWP